MILNYNELDQPAITSLKKSFQAVPKNLFFISQDKESKARFRFSDIIHTRGNSYRQRSQKRKNRRRSNLRSILIYEPHRKKGIPIPDKVDVKLNGNVLSVKDRWGEMMRLISDDVEVKISDKIISVVLRKGAPNKAVWGHSLLT